MNKPELNQLNGNWNLLYPEALKASKLTADQYAKLAGYGHAQSMQKSSAYLKRMKALVLIVTRFEESPWPICLSCNWIVPTDDESEWPDDPPGQKWPCPNCGENMNDEFSG